MIAFKFSCSVFVVYVIHHKRIEIKSEVTGHQIGLVLNFSFQLRVNGVLIQFLSQVHAVHVDWRRVGPLTVPLRGTECGQTQAMAATGFGSFDVVRPGLREETVGESIIGLVAARHVQEALVLAAKHTADRISHVPIRAHLALVIQFAVGIFIATGQNVHGSANGGQRQFARPESTLHLEGFHHQIQPRPIAPVDLSGFHVVHGYPVHHDRQVGLVKPADGHPRIAIAPTLLGGVHTRGGVQDHGQVPTCELFLDLGWKHVGEGHWGFAVDGDVGHHNRFLHHEGFQRKGHKRVRSFAIHLPLLGLVADVAHFERHNALGQGNVEAAVEVGRHHLISSFDVGADQGLTTDGVADFSFQLAQLGRRFNPSPSQPAEEHIDQVLHETQCWTTRRPVEMWPSAWTVFTMYTPCGRSPMSSDMVTLPPRLTSAATT